MTHSCDMTQFLSVVVVTKISTSKSSIYVTMTTSTYQPSVYHLLAAQSGGVFRLLCNELYVPRTLHVTNSIYYPHIYCSSTICLLRNKVICFILCVQTIVSRILCVTKFTYHPHINRPSTIYLLWSEVVCFILCVTNLMCHELDVSRT